MVRPSGTFQCDIKALTPTERACHQELTDELVAKRKKVVETKAGYEFHYSPAEISLAKIAE